MWYITLFGNLVSNHTFSNYSLFNLHFFWLISFLNNPTFLSKKKIPFSDIFLHFFIYSPPRFNIISFWVFRKRYIHFVWGCQILPLWRCACLMVNTSGVTYFFAIKKWCSYATSWQNMRKFQLFTFSFSVKSSYVHKHIWYLWGLYSYKYLSFLFLFFWVSSISLLLSEVHISILWYSQVSIFIETFYLAFNLKEPFLSHVLYT